MNEYEAIMISPEGADVIVSAWGSSVEDAAQRAGDAVLDTFPGWTVTLTGDLRQM